MKIIAVLLVLTGIGGLSTVAEEPASILLCAAFFFGAYKLWTRKPKQKAPATQHLPANPYMNMNEPLQPIDYTGIIVRGDEKVYFAIPAETFVNKTRVTGYQSESSGSSVRVVKGLSVSNRSRQTQAVRENVNDIKGKGDYVVTNKRVVFVGLGDSFDIPLNKITSVSMVAHNGFVLLADGKAHNITAGEPGSEYACKATLEVINMFVE